MSRRTPVSVIGLAVLLAWGCQKSAPPDAARKPVPSKGLRLCVIQDRTGSIRQTRTVTLKPEHLDALLDILKGRGGEIGLGLVAERSDLPLLRRAIEPLPPRPEPPKNPLVKKYWEETELRKWEAERDRREAEIRAFRAEALERLKAPLAPRSDVCGALRRCDLMLSEPFPHPTDALMLFVSDGRHNVRESPCPEKLRSQAPILLVNGEGLLGALEPYGPRLFESVEAALRFLREGGGP